MKIICKNDGATEYIKKIDDVLSVDSRERLFQDYIISPFLQSILDDYDVVPVDIKVSGKIHNYELYCGRYGYIDKEKKLQKSIETPDLCVSKTWKWLNHNMQTEDYTLTVEIKTPFSDNQYWISPGYIDGKIVFENKVSDILNFVNDVMLRKENGEYAYGEDDQYPKSIGKQIGIHMRSMKKVIVTDGIRWIFFYKKQDKCFELATIDLGKRICKRPRKHYKHVQIDWDNYAWEVKGKKLYQGPLHFELLKYIIKEFCVRDIEDLDDLKNIIERRKNNTKK